MGPCVSVVMSVRNGMPYLPEAVHSILSQTFADFEFIIMDNASTDGTPVWIEALADPRIVFVRNEKDLGLSASLNRGFALAKGEYIARMDADDISLPERFALQVAFMDANPDVAVCGGEVELFGASSTKIWGVQHNQDEMRATLLFGVPLVHPAVMYRRSVWQNFALQYDESLKLTQDFDMWRQLVFVHGQRISNIKECILRYRVQGQNATSLQQDILKNEFHQVEQKILMLFIDHKASYEQTELHYLMNMGSISVFENIDVLAAHFNFLIDSNKKKKIIETRIFNSKIAAMLESICLNTKLDVLTCAFWRFFVITLHKNDFARRSSVIIAKVMIKKIILKLKSI